MSADELDAVILGSLRAHGEAGATTVRDLGDRDYRTLPCRDRSSLPRVVASGPPITSRDGHCHFLGGAVGGDLRTAVRERVDRGVDVIKVMASGGFATPGSDMFGAQLAVAEITTIVETAHDASLPVVAHAHSLLGMENALAAGADGIEHFTGLTAGRPRFDPALLDETARRGVYVDLTMGNDRSLHSRMPDPPPVVAQLLAGLGVRTFDEFYTSRLGVLSLLREHGVTVIAGVDSGMAPDKRHGNVWRTIEDLTDAGYSMTEPLAAATSVAAEACGLGGETGRLAPGYAADVLVVDGDLAEDASGLGTPQLVLVRGEPITLP